MIRLKMKSSEEMGQTTAVDYEILLDDEVIGWLDLVKLNEDDVVVDDLQIHEAYRNQGNGTNVLKMICEDTWGSVFLAPTDENNQRLYERLGQEVESDALEIDQGYGVYGIN